MISPEYHKEAIISTMPDNARDELGLCRPALILGMTREATSIKWIHRHPACQATQYGLSKVMILAPSVYLILDRDSNSD